MHSIEKNTYITNKHLKRCLTPLVIMKMLVKNSIQCKLKPYITERLKLKKKKVVVAPVMVKMKRNLITQHC